MIFGMVDISLRPWRTLKSCLVWYVEDKFSEVRVIALANYNMTSQWHHVKHWQSQLIIKHLCTFAENFLHADLADI